MDLLDPLLAIARDLTACLASADRYQRLLESARSLIPYDAACLLRLDGEELIPLAGVGLRAAAMERRYRRRDHPRFDQILAARGPIRFPADSPLPDPFDGLLVDDHHDVHGIHACMGCPLFDGSELVGALTADAMEAEAFQDLDQRMLATLGALAGAALRTSTLIEAIEARAAHRTRVARDMLATQLAHNGTFIGSSPATRAVLQQVDVVAGTQLPVLITGETGVGKELIAHLVHQHSRRHDEAFIEVNCAALPASLAESELFGHLPGAFTGAGQARAGKFSIADGGTLFLDEIGELPLEIQATLLRALQSGEIQRVGSDRPTRVDVRIVAATNRDLVAEITRGRFRADLFHRLGAFPIHVPPLRERQADIPQLAMHFAEQMRCRLGLETVRIDEETVTALRGAGWPGNVRELANVVQRGVLLAAAEARQPGQPILLQARHMSLRQGPTTPGSRDDAAPQGQVTASLRDQVDSFRRRTIRAALARHDGNQAAAARELGLHRSNLHQLIRRLGLH